MKAITKIFILSMILLNTFPVLAQAYKYPSNPGQPLPFGSELLFAGILAAAGYFGIKGFRKAKKS